MPNRFSQSGYRQRFPRCSLPSRLLTIHAPPHVACQDVRHDNGSIIHVERTGPNRTRSVVIINFIGYLLHVWIIDIYYKKSYRNVTSRCNFNPHVYADDDDVIKWKHFPRYWHFVRGIHRSPVNFPHKGQWRGALMFSLICDLTKGRINNRDPGDLGRHRAHHDVIVMPSW